MIVIVDADIGNLGSILNMLKRIGAKALISSSVADIAGADKLILPGDGSFNVAMKNLADARLTEILRHRVIDDGIPILGICLGMQIFGKSSEEGELPGLDWIDARSVRFRFEPPNLERIPHMGWNSVKIVRDCPLVRNLGDQPRFYFVHSYHLVCADHEDVVMTTSYGTDFVSSIHHENIYGTQFHPEKSHKFGMTLLKNFAEVC